MPRELIAPARMEAVFRDYESPPLESDEIRVLSRFGAAKHGSEMAMFQGYAGHRGNYDGQLAPLHAGKPDGQVPGRPGATSASAMWSKSGRM